MRLDNWHFWPPSRCLDINSALYVYNTLWKRREDIWKCIFHWKIRDRTNLFIDFSSTNNIRFFDNLWWIFLLEIRQLFINKFDPYPSKRDGLGRTRRSTYHRPYFSNLLFKNYYLIIDYAKTYSIPKWEVEFYLLIFKW